MSDTLKMRAYFRNPPSRVPTGSGRETSIVGGLAIVLLEYPRDHFLQRRVLNAHVRHFVPVQDRAECFRHPAAVHTQLSGDALPAGHSAESLQALRGVGGELK